MTGALWAGLSGVGFGVFQVLNARAVRGLDRVYLATFVQLLAATAVFGLVVAGTSATADLSLIPYGSLLWFALSGVLHFFIGWTTLNQSQARIGAARTAPLIATAPVFGVVLVVLTGVVPSPAALVGVALAVVGAYIVTTPDREVRPSLGDSGLGLVTAAVWALSAVCTVEGLAGFDDPLLGVTVGVAAAVAAYGLALALARLGSRRSAKVIGMGRRAWMLKIVAGVVVALATWWRWLALADATVEVVLALQLLTVPTVLLLTLVLGESVSRRVWVGALVVIAGVGVLVGGT